MHISFATPLRRAATAAIAVAALGATATAQAKPVTATLRVEAAGDALDGGTTYVTDTTRFQTDEREGCNGSGATKTLAGPTAMGILGSALPVNKDLKPVGISDEFDFGLTVCGIGEFVGFGSTSYWLYKVNHKSPEVGGDGYTLKPGDEVLWFFQNTESGDNTGDELVIDAPARARPGKAFQITVYGYDFNGKRAPVEGARVRGESVQTTDADGHATITASKRRTVLLRADHESDIPSAPTPVCIGGPRRCSARRGEHIVGSNKRDRITGTPGDDRIQARGGRDRINVAGGGRDRVNCGRGKDVVVKDRRDRASRNCERVRNRK